VRHVRAALPALAALRGIEAVDGVADPQENGAGWREGDRRGGALRGAIGGEAPERDPRRRVDRAHEAAFAVGFGDVDGPVLREGGTRRAVVLLGGDLERDRRRRDPLAQRDPAERALPRRPEPLAARIERRFLEPVAPLMRCLILPLRAPASALRLAPEAPPAESGHGPRPRPSALRRARTTGSGPRATSARRGPTRGVSSEGAFSAACRAASAAFAVRPM